jgi:hypothetical protein
MRRPSGPRRLSDAWGSWDEVGGGKKSVQGPNSRGSDAMRGIQTGQRRRVKRTRGFFIKAGGWIWCGGSSSAKMLADQQDLGMEWNGMVLEVRIVVELCVLCWALATVGDLRRGPCWYGIGWCKLVVGTASATEALPRVPGFLPRLPPSPSP